MHRKPNNIQPLFIRPLERRVMLDAAFGETFDPETTTTFEGGSVQTGYSYTGADVATGDFNGDGYDDLLVLTSHSQGRTTLIFGSADRTDMGDLTDAELDASNSITFTSDYTYSQEHLTFLGDINNDGYDDIAIASPGDAGAEGVRVVLGQASSNSTISLLDTTQSNVFHIKGAADDVIFGHSMAGAGDVNNDGYDDIIIGSPQSGTYDAGRGYVIFGHGGSFSNINFASDSLDGTDGFVINGYVNGATGDQLGADVSTAGDFNGDGIDDVAISSVIRSSGSGAAFVVYGQDSGFVASINVNDLDATTGMSIYGGTADSIAVNDFGATLESAGDFNGDGFDDLAVSNYTGGADKYADNDGVHVIYGNDSQPAELTTDDIDGTNGMFIRTGNGIGEFGAEISNGADLDGDGYDDLVISAHGEDTNGFNSGAAYVIYGNSRGNAVLVTSTMESADGTHITYGDATNTEVNRLGTAVAIGNFDGDTYNDIVISDSGWDSNAGKVHYFYGIKGNTPPSITAIADQTVIEETSTADLAFTIDDVDGEALSVSVTSSDLSLIPNGNMVISGTGSDRTIRVTPADDQTGTATISITVEDTRGSETTESFDITVNNVNDAPTMTDISDQTTAENTGTGFIPFTLNDVDGDYVTLSATSSNTNLVPNGNIAFWGSGMSRSIGVTPASGQIGTTTITVTADDGNGGVTTQTFDVMVTSVTNDAPTITSISDQTINEGTVAGPIAFTVGDADGHTVNISAASSNTALIPNGNIVINGSGANRTITMTPLAEQFGTATITLTLDDGNGATVTEVFDVTVNSVNDAPTMTSIDDQTIDQDTNTGALAFTVSDVEGDTIAVSASSSNTVLVPNGNISVTGTGANREVSVTPAAGQSGTATITLSLDDGNGGITTQTFDVVVNAIQVEAESGVKDDIIALEGGDDQPAEAPKTARNEPISKNVRVERQSDAGQAAQGAFSLTVSNMNAENFNQTFYGSQLGSLNEYAQTSSQRLSQSDASSAGRAVGMNDQMIDIVTTAEQSIYGDAGGDGDAYLRYWDKLYEAENAPAEQGGNQGETTSPSNIEPFAGEQDGLDTQQKNENNSDKEAQLIEGVFKPKTLTATLTHHAREFDQAVERFIDTL